jgi:multidrug transporter EmrE-like cation transporter
VTLLFVYAVSKKNKKDEKAKFPKEIVGYILVMAVCLFLNSFFKTLAANHLDAVLLYPLNQGSALILNSVMCAVAFKERLNFKGILGITIAFVSLVVINLF